MTEYSVMVVNDDPTQLVFLSRVLEKSGYNVTRAGDAIDALELLRTDCLPDLIVTDLHMPGIDGWQFCRLLRSPEFSEFNTRPILVVSATFAGEDVRRITRDLGANSFLAMPVKRDAFEDEVKRLLDGQGEAKRSRILIIDHDANTVELLADVFETYGYEVASEGSIESGSRKFDEWRPDVVLFEYHLPDCTGSCLIDRFRVLFPQTAFVVMTEDADPRLAVDLMRKGISAYIRKPFAPEYVVKIVEQTSRERALLGVEDLLEERTLQLRQSEEKHRVLFDNVDAPITYLDLNGIILMVNPASAKILGGTPADIEGTSIYDYLPALEGRIVELIAGVVQSGTAHQSEDFIVIRGRGYWFSTTFQPVRDLSGKITAVQVFGYDVTDQKETRDALAKERERARQYLDIAGGIILALDRRGEVTLINAEGSQILGYEQDELISREWFSLVLPKHHTAAAWEAFNQVMAGQMECVPQVEGLVVTSSGQERSVVWNNTLLRDEHGVPAGTLSFGTDITERKEMEKQLQISESKWRSLVQHAPNYIIITDQDGRIEFANMFPEGLTERDVLGSSIFDYVDPDYHEAARSVLRDVFVSGQPARCEYRSGGRMASRRYFETNVGPIWQDGRITALTLIGLDITKRKKIQDEILRNRDFLRSIFDAAVDVSIIVTDLDGRDAHITEFSTGAENIFGFKRDDVIGKPVAMLHRPEDVDKFPDLIDDMVCRRQSFHGEMTLVRSGGEEFAALFTAYPLVDAADQVYAALGISIDISARKKIEDQLRQSEARYRFLTEASPDVVWMTDMNMQSYYISPSCQSVFGVSPDEFMKIKLEDKLPPQSMEKAALILAREMEIENAGNADPNRFITFELEHYHPHNSLFWVELSVSFIRDESGKPVGLHGITRDISARKRAEQERQKLQKQIELTRKFESLNVMAGSIAHNFNNILMAVMGNLEMVMGEISSADSISHNVIGAYNSAKRAAEMSNIMLTFVGQAKIDKAPVDLVGLVAAIGEEIDVSLQDKIELRLELPSDPCVVDVDSSSIRKALVNLLTNSMEAMAESGGSVALRIYEVQHAEDVQTYLNDVLPAGRYVVVDISDSGPGIDSEHLSKIFDPFFTTKFVGRGLGLPEVLGLVRAHKGGIQLQNRPGYGCTFSLFLPRTDAARGV